MTPPAPTPLVGGKSSGKGRGGNKGYGNHQGKKGKKGKGQGYGKGGGKGCEDVSPCTIRLNITGEHGKKDRGNADAGAHVPPAHAADIMEANLRVAHQNTEWLRLTASAIDEKLLERCRNSATHCVPLGAVKALNEVLLIRRGLIIRINDIVKQTNELSLKLHIDMTKFRDATTNKIVDVTEGPRLTDLLMSGKLSFGGMPLRGLLFTENEGFKNRIFEDHGAKASDWFNKLTFGQSDNMFAVQYHTNMGTCEIVFSVGMDGRAVQPHVDRAGSGNRDILLLTAEKAEELGRQLERVGVRRASQMSHRRSSSRLLSSRV